MIYSKDFLIAFKNLCMGRVSLCHKHQLPMLIVSHSEYCFNNVKFCETDTVPENYYYLTSTVQYEYCI